MLIEKAKEILNQKVIKSSSSKKNTSPFSIGARNPQNQDIAISLQSTTKTNFISAINQLSLQIVNFTNEEILKKSKKNLNLLKKLSLDIMEGKISIDSLNELQNSIETINAKDLIDPTLMQVFDEIQLRVKIELAKYQ